LSWIQSSACSDTERPEVSPFQISAAFCYPGSVNPLFPIPSAHCLVSVCSWGKSGHLHSLPYKSPLHLLISLVSPSVIHTSILLLQSWTGWAVFLFLSHPLTFTTFLYCIHIKYCLRKHNYPPPLHPFHLAGWDISALV